MPPYFQTLHTTQSFNMLFTDAQITSDRTIRNYYAQDMFIVIKRGNSETNCSKYINDAQIYWSWTFWHLPHYRLYFRSPWIPGRSVQQNWPHMALGRTGWLCRPLSIKKPVRLNIAVMGTGKKCEWPGHQSNQYLLAIYNLPCWYTVAGGYHLATDIWVNIGSGNCMPVK